MLLPTLLDWLSDTPDPDAGLLSYRRISEELQKDEPVMAALRRVGALPDKVVTLARGAEGGVLLGSGGETAEVDLEVAAHLFVRRL